jgi:predicted nucleic acid-binding protein
LARGNLYRDANALIALIEAEEPRRTELGAALASMIDTVRLLTSEITYSEVLVGPLKRNDAQREAIYHDVFNNPALLTVLPVSRSILTGAAHLRRVSSMRLPDAIHVATAVEHGCDALMSDDKGLFMPANLQPIGITADALLAWAAA